MRDIRRRFSGRLRVSAPTVLASLVFALLVAGFAGIIRRSGSRSSWNTGPSIPWQRRWTWRHVAGQLHAHGLMARITKY